MSADNGVYILVSPIKAAFGKEYRVAHNQAIENLDHFEQGSQDGQAMEVLYYHNAPVFYSEKEALDYAHFISKNYQVLEYGVCLLDERKFPYPEMSFETANEILR